MVTIYNTTTKTVSGSCQCKNECGGSQLFTYSSTPTAFNSTRWLASLTGSASLSYHPTWVVQALEDLYVFKDNCKCGLHGNWSTFDKNVFDSLTAYTALQVVNVFFPSSPFLTIIYNGVEAVMRKAYYMAFTEIFFPFFLLFSLFNIVMAIKLYSKEATAFTFQIAQYVASLFALLFNSFWLRNIIRIFYAYNPVWFITFTETFLFYCQLMAFCLMADRCLSVLKPFIYKNHASPKKALLICFSSLLLSFLLASVNILNKYTNSILYITATFVAGILYGLLVFFEIALIVFFLIRTKSMISVNSVQLKQSQKNINFILISSSFIESICGVCYMTYVFIQTILVLGTYKVSADIVNFMSPVETNVSFARNYFICFGPFISLAFCITFSKTYRKAFYSLFKCYCICKQNDIFDLSAVSQQTFEKSYRGSRTV